MTEDRFLDRLRKDAQQLRYEPEDDFAWTRLTARIQERMRAQPPVAQLLAQWFRPVAASLAVLLIVAALSVQWTDTTPPATVEAMAAAPASDLGDALSVE